jgi:hypothetical protein
MPSRVHGVASGCTVIAFTPVAFIDVITGISGLAIVDNAFMDRGCLVPLWRSLGMNQGLFLLSGGLRGLLRCNPMAPRGRTLGLL